MKIKNFSTLILTSTLALPSIGIAAENITVSGADYIQSSNIIGKEIQNVLSSTGECDIEDRDFTTGTEIRTYKNSTDGHECYTLSMNNQITESTFTNIGYTYGEDTYEYDPGALVLAETMTVGESWGGVSSVTLNDVEHGTREDTFTLEAVEDLSVTGGDFSECLRINWVIDYSYRPNLNINLWICPEVGVAKYEYVGSDNSWELQDYTLAGEEPVTVSGEDYIQSEEIIGKEIQNIFSSTGECDIESRDFTTGTEIRTYKNSTNDNECYTLNIENKITESTFTNTGYTFDADTYEYDPGALVIAETMTVGESWGGFSNVTLNGAEHGTREDTFTLLAIEDVSVAGGEFNECLKINWVIDYSYRADLNINLWLCPEFGIAKYVYVGSDNSWELQSYTIKTNSEPTISGNPESEILENVQYTFTPIAEDIDEDTLTFSIENKPAWASFDNNSGSLVGTPGYTDSGIYEDIVITVTDGEDSASLPAFSITVNNVNRAPTISGTPNTSVLENQAYSFTPEASDLDGDTITFSITNKPTWASFDTATGTLTGTPANEDVGEYIDIIISVSDGEDITELDSFDITVLAVDKGTEEDGGSGGGGSIPLCLIFIFGIIAIRRKH